MNRLLDAVKRVTLTHALLFAIAAFLLMTWLELKAINKSLASTALQAQFIEGDLSDIDTDLKNIETDLDNYLPEK